MDNIRKLPVGIQSFEDIRRKNFLYVDKTRYIWDLQQKGKVFFLSRPRRFGKSLMVSTMEAYFLGKKELFEGLAIEELEKAQGEDAWLQYPVMRFSFSGGNYQTAGGLENTLGLVVADAEEQYGLDRAGLDLPNRFRNALKKICNRTGRQVVVLVDEYDKPLLDAGSPEMEDRNRAVYKGFFGVLKDQDEYLKFAFFTGVTKFSKISIFSDLNQLKDLSLLDSMSGICGITEHEMREQFVPEIRRLAEAQNLTEEKCLAELAKTYDGYHFSKGGVGVYNPFSLLNAFSDLEFGRYWFESATPTFLIKRLQKSGIRAEQFDDGVDTTEAKIRDYRTENPDPVPLFYQSGYLTIRGYEKRFDIYHLGFPNEEVRYGFLNSLLPYVLGEPHSEAPYSGRNMVLALEKGDTETLRKQLYSLFASAPYIEGKALDYEGVWRNQIYILFASLGQYVTCETHTSLGRCDCTIETAEYIYIFEFKMTGSTQADSAAEAAEDALNQIERKDYARRYLSDRRQVIRVGAVFSGETRNITAWEAKKS